LKRSFGSALPLLFLAACATNDPQSIATAVTRAVYSDNANAAAGYFDERTRPQVSRAGVGVLSDKMHELGAFNGLTLLANDSATREYTYRAAFAKGTMNVVVRLDPDGRIAAYRAFPN
jgi:hypothetical protein